MRLDYEERENGTDDSLSMENSLHLVPGSHGMNVPSACTIVIIAGIDIKQRKENMYFCISILQVSTLTKSTG